MKKRIILIVIIFIVLFLGYRKDYGNWNPFSPPEKIYCYDRVYRASGSLSKEFSQDNKPKYRVPSRNIIIGKKLYRETNNPKQIPTVIYLHVGNNKFKSYGLVGGP